MVGVSAWLDMHELTGASCVMTLMLVLVGVGVSGGRVPAARGEERISSTTGSTGGSPRPVFGIHTPAVGVPRPASPDTPAETAVGGGSTSVVGQGAPLAIASQNCQPSAASASDLQNEFNIRGPVWGGGDGAEPVPIDNGRTLWLFGDTYLGGGPLNGPLDNRGFVHNSMAVQYNGSCFAYLFRGDPQTGWYSAIPEPSDTDYYWPNAAAYDPVSGVLTISAMRVHTVDPNNPWGWQLVGVDAIHYQVTPSLAIVSVERLFTFGPNDRAQFGTNLLARPGRRSICMAAPSPSRRSASWPAPTRRCRRARWASGPAAVGSPPWPRPTPSGWIVPWEPSCMWPKSVTATSPATRSR